MFRLAVSEVVGSLLMVVMVVALASIVLVAVNQWVYTQRGSTLQMMREAFIVEDVWFRRIGGVRIITVTIYNYGGVRLTVSRIYVNGTLALSGVYSVEPGGHLSIDVGYDWVEDAKHSIVIYTESGRVVRIEERAPRI
ncbi:MAG: archaellin/type IV pilin N-terminal domain-containing protein [Candidatus Bathyarchaeia archaeon]